ncbi:glycosyltransferase [bacterium]|nr:glycosyltransferase [bacterium]
MLKDKNIIFFSADDWGCGLMTSKTHIADLLSEENNLLYINSIGLRQPKINSQDARKIFNKIGMFFKGVRKVKDRMWVFTPVVIPFHKYKMVQIINKWLLILFVKIIQKMIGLHKPILFTFLPNTVDVVGKFGESKIIFYCVDEFSIFEGVHTESVLEMEKRLIQKSDIVLATSQKLFESKSKFNSNTFLMPHGVDVEHFSQAMSDETKIPDDIKEIKKPIIGFFGLLDDRFDQDLICKVAKTKPEWSIVLISKTVVPITKLEECKNIHILGQRDYKTLPAYCKAFDIGIIPYILNEQTENVNPIKLREYLASGIPVVSTKLPEVVKYDQVALIAADHDDFMKSLEIALKENTREKIMERMKFVEKESWKSKAEEISNIIGRS